MASRNTKKLLGGVAAWLVAGGALAAPAVPEPGLARMDLQMAPQMHAGGAASGIAVRYQYQPEPGMENQPLELSFDTLEPQLGRSTDQVADIVVRDADGQLPMLAGPDREVDDHIMHTWRSSRPVAGKVEVSYRVPVASPQRRAGPGYDMQAAGDGVAGSGAAFLLLPVAPRPMHVSMAWDMPPGLSGMSSFGPGSQRLDTTADKLRNSFYIAGSFYRYPAGPVTTGLVVHGLGQLTYDPSPVFAWEKKLFDYAGTQFHGPREQVFNIFFRSYPGGSATGMQLNSSMQLFLPADPHAPLRQLLAHEMTHARVPQMDHAEGYSAWYPEGTATYFSFALPYQAGMFTPREYLQMVNENAATYYGNAKRSVPDNKLAEAMWVGGADSWTTHYTRGAMYLADLDAKLRKRSDGKVGMLTLVNEMIDRRQRGEVADLDVWRNLLDQYGGTGAAGTLVRDLQDMMDGKVIFPTENAFGACFVGKPGSIGVFDVGYESGRSGAATVVTKVAGGSNAHKAGLRVGDELVGKPDLGESYENVDRPITLKIKRAGVAQTITFLPRGDAVTAMFWEPRSGNPDRPCGDAR